MKTKSLIEEEAFIIRCRAQDVLNLIKDRNMSKELALQTVRSRSMLGDQSWAEVQEKVDAYLANEPKAPPIYLVKPTSQNGQSILESTKRRGESPVIAEISIQLPTEKAIEIAHAVNEYKALYAVADAAKSLHAEDLNAQKAHYKPIHDALAALAKVRSQQ